MKILTLNLRAFGSFSDLDLDLSQGNCGVHIIYGPNEAGKSTALRALEQLLFGIPGNSADNFIHPYPRLRIGASLNRSDGKTLHFLRRKGTKNTLLQPDDKTPLDDGVLERFLDGLDHRVFTTMFGIDHGRLEQGGRMLATGGGSVGAALFAAATGISNYRTVCEGLEAESKKLFAPRASKATINANLAALKDARKKIREAQLPSSQWMEHEDALRHADDRLKQLDAELQGASRQRSRLERLRQALPLAVKRKALLAQQASLGDVAILPADFAGQRREAVATLAITRKTEKEADESIQQLNQKIEQLVVPETLLAESEAIESLRDRLGAHRKAQRDREALHVQKKQLQDNAASLLSRLRPDLSLDVVDGLRLTSQQKVGIVNQGNRHGALVKQLEQAETDIERLQVELDRVNDALTNLEPARDTRLLHDAVRRAQSQGDLDTQAATALGDLERLQNQVAVELQRLPLWTGSLDQLDQLAVPSAETVDHFDDQLAQIAGEIALLDRDQKAAKSQLAECLRKQEELQLQGEVPTEADLAAARRRRDLGWQLVLQSWQTGQPEPSRLQSFLAEIGDRGDLATAYAAAVQAADEIADRLRREAHRVAQQAALESERNKLEQHLDDLQKRLEQADSQRQHAWQSWVQCWQPLGIEPRWPREMRAWLQQQRAIIARADAIRNAQNAVDQLHNRIKAHRDELQQRLAELGEPWTDQRDWLAPRLGRAQTLLDHAAAVAETRATLENDRQRLSRQLDDTRQSARQANDRLAEWQQQWAIAIESLGLPPATTPDVANEFVARLDDLFTRLDEAKDRAFRIDQIAHDADQFRDDVAAIARRIDPDLAPLEPEPQVEELVRRLRAATADSQSLASLVEQRSHQESVRETAHNTIDEMRARLDSMCQEARCSDPEQLPEAIKASEAAIRLRDLLQPVEEQLMQLCGGGTLETLLAEAEAIDADCLPADTAALAERIAAMETERDELRERRGREQKTLEMLDTSAATTDAAEGVQDLLARIENEAVQYARLRIASAVLREGVERYRKKNEDPLLRRASELFRRLTLGSFTELRADVNERGDNVLVGVREGGNDPVGLAGMSDGTCDQLYLALRLASLENYLKQNEPVPLVVDDILIRFDDRRASAALEVLGEVSRWTQVLFFTHHDRLVQLAEAHLQDSQRFIYRLPGRAPKKNNEERITNDN